MGRRVQRVDQYEIHERIGGGGQAIVYRATDVQTKGVVAFKSLNRTSAHDIARLKKEVEACEKLAAVPTVIPVLDYQVAGAPYYAVFPYVKDGDLQGSIEKLHRAHSGADLLRMCFDLAQGMREAYSHSDGPILHRDLKPKNILVDIEAGQLFIADWGLVRHSDEEGPTRIGERVGARYYSAPEIDLPGGAANFEESCDVYSLGKVFAFILTGGLTIPREDVSIIGDLLRLETEMKPLVMLLLYGMVADRVKRIGRMEIVCQKLSRILERGQPPSILAGELTAEIGKLEQQTLKAKEATERREALQRAYETLLQQIKTALDVVAEVVHTELSTRAVEYSKVEGWQAKVSVIEQRGVLPSGTMVPLMLHRGFHFELSGPGGPRNLLLLIYVSDPKQFAHNPDRCYVDGGGFDIDGALISDNMHPNHSSLFKQGSAATSRSIAGRRVGLAVPSVLENLHRAGRTIRFKLGADEEERIRAFARQNISRLIAEGRRA